MINYNKGKIYKIEPNCEHEEHEIYIGSTTKDKLCQRMATHRDNYKQWKKGYKNGKYKVMSFDLFDKYGVDNCCIILLENAMCNSKDELFAREKYYIQNTNNLNRYIPSRTVEEKSNYQSKYYQENKEKAIDYAINYRKKNNDSLLAKKKLYYEKNKSIISEKAKEKHECDCGGCYTKVNKTIHFRTKRHQDYFKAQSEN